MPKKLTYEYTKECIEQLGYKLISEEYKNNSTKLIICDKQGYYYLASQDMIMRRTPRKFQKSNPYTIQNIKLWCKLNNKSFELLSDIFEIGDKKLKWKCLSKDCGEIFYMDWENIYQNRNCPYCSGHKVGLSNCLATKNPDLAKEWHPTKNGDLTPYDVTANNDKKIWWRCKYNSNHVWNAIVSSRNFGNGCPYCCNKKVNIENCLATTHPDLVAEWHTTKNGNLTPFDLTYGSEQYVWWQCSKNPKHEWYVSANIRTNNNTGCPYCVKTNGGYTLPSEDYNLLLYNPQLCEEWDYIKNNKYPNEFTPNSGEKVWWKCKECGYEWKAGIVCRNGRWKTGCPECNKSKGEKRIKEIFILKDFDEITQENYDTLFDIDKQKSIYFISQKTFNDLRGLGNKLLLYDFYLPQYNLLIEYQGQFHDGNGNKGNYYMKQNLKRQQEHDRRKREYAKNNNINLLEIWYWDYNNIEEILEKQLLNVGGGYYKYL